MNEQQKEIERCRKDLWKFAEHYNFDNLQKYDLLRITQKLYKLSNKRTFWQRIKYKLNKSKL